MRVLLMFLLFVPVVLMSQNDLPSEGRITSDGRLQFGGNETEGFYDTRVVNKLEILLSEPDWFMRMDGRNGGPGGGSDGEELIGTLIFNDSLRLDSVLVSIKGQTSDSRNRTEKKSFSIKIDDLVDQELMGYDNLNLNCAFDDHSGMREVLYYDISRGFTSALKGNFVDLYINGESWGPYNNIQQLEGTYIQEWFTDNDGTRWRANPGTGGGGPGGGGNDPSRFGAGTNTLNYNGPDTLDYIENYELKKASKENPWEDLIIACDKLNNTPIEDLYNELKDVLDIDRALWFLAQEIVFSDDDGYFHKGGMDYYVYWDHATGRIVPMEVDGNSVMSDRYVDWSPFYREDDDRFPLIHRLFQNLEIRQRYLAHLRYVLAEYFVPEKVNARIDVFANILDQRVQDDPKKIYSYNQFVDGVTALKAYVEDRAAFLNGHVEIDREGLNIVEHTQESSSGSEDVIYPDDEVFVTVEIDGDASMVVLYYGLGLDGVYERVEMKDDGLNNDGNADDRIYGAVIPNQKAGRYIRYYFEVIRNDDFMTATYYPPGAEHDVFVYQVQQSRVLSSDVVINEFMAANDSAVSDNAGEEDDWIELYNNGADDADLTGHYLSDDEGEFDKWQFPDGTILPAGGYLIIWADDDEEQATADTLHANFKISAGGEILTLSNPDGEIIDQIDFDEQKDDISFARIPNGTGDFMFRTQTFNENNDNSISSLTDGALSDLKIYPNPVRNILNIEWGTSKLKEHYVVNLVDVHGRTVLSFDQDGHSMVNTIDLSAANSGTYILTVRDQRGKVYARKKLVLIK